MLSPFGMGPDMITTMATIAMDLLDDPREIFIIKTNALVEAVSGLVLAAQPAP